MCFRMYLETHTRPRRNFLESKPTSAKDKHLIQKEGFSCIKIVG